MTSATQVHMDAMLRLMNTLTTQETGAWCLIQHKSGMEVKTMSLSLAEEVIPTMQKDTQTRKSISGYSVLLKGAPVIFTSSTHKLVALSVCKAEQSSGVLCTQDMLYCKNVLESMGLKVKLPMLLKMDKKGAVDLANNWSVGGQTRHVDVQQCFLQELKETKIMDICLIKGSENDADVFTKNLDGPAFEKRIKTLVGQDVDMKKSGYF
jgi:hypothetical protein